MNLSLIGYRSTGKSTIGRMLSDVLGWAFVDTDTLIQERAAKSIREIVADGGWQAFRRTEREVVADVAKRDDQVISAGGGVILDSTNSRLLREAGKVVLLTCPPEVIWQRMQADAKTKAERPDLTAAGGLEEVRRVLAERAPKYEAACHYRIATDRFLPEETAGRILAWLKAKRFI